VSEWVSEWVIVVYRQFSNLSAISWGEQVNIQWDDDEVRFVLDQQAELDFYSDIYQSMGRHVALHGHLIQIPSQPVFAPSPYCCVLSGEATNTNFYSLWFVPIDARSYRQNNRCGYIMALWTYKGGLNRIAGVMVTGPASCVVDRGFERRSGQTKDYKN
jgi:hypothetical protein